MSETPPFLTEEQILSFHHDQIKRFGGQEGIRDPGLLLSAMALPEASLDGKYFHKYPFGMAAAYAYHIAENQAFVDGNKRTALDCALTFLELCGITIDDPEGKLHEAMMEVGNHRLSKSGLEKLFEQLVLKQGK